MVNVRRCARLAQKTRSRARILGYTAVDDLERHHRVQHCIARAVSDGHRAGAKLDRKTIRSDFDFEVCISQRSGGQSSPPSWAIDFFAVTKETKADKTTQAFALWTALG
jgi:hypothetical protein